MIEKETHEFTGPSNGNNPFLFGHKEQIAFLLNCIRTNQIPNAWLFHGPVGIGKASLALNVAKVLSNNRIRKEDSLSYLSEKDIRNPDASLQVTNIFFCKRKWDYKKKLFHKTISIDDIGSGKVSEVVVTNDGSGYSVGDKLVFDNTNTQGVNAQGFVSVVNGGITAESGTNADNIVMEDSTGQMTIILEIKLYKNQQQTEILMM